MLPFPWRLSLSRPLFVRRAPLPGRRRGRHFPETLVPVCGVPPEIADAVFHQARQTLNAFAEHVLQAFGDVFLPRPVHADALHAVSVAMAAHLCTGESSTCTGSRSGTGAPFRVRFMAFSSTGPFSGVLVPGFPFHPERGEGNYLISILEDSPRNNNLFRSLLYFRGVLD